ncbi:MAG: hypothetical protein HOV79_14530 [Hamadaea sp.]|nr:hypothetical protein [Hamadaea sp.]
MNLPQSLRRAASVVSVAGGLAGAILAPATPASQTPAAAAPSSATASASASPSASPSASASTAKAATVSAAALGLDETQLANARTIVEVGRDLGLSQRAQIIAVATAMQESALYNLASTALPESYDYAHEGDGSDHDSVGLFQQRPSAGWGTVAQIMDPQYAAKAFYDVLVTVDGWQSMALTAAAQSVQVSAYPDAYAKHETAATAIVKALNAA